MRSPQISRRGFLGAVLGGAAMTAGCSPIIDHLTKPELPDTLKPPTGLDRHPIAHLLNRATFGPTPGQIAEVEKMGKEKWIDQQLDFRAIDDENVDWRLRRYDSLKFKPVDLLSFKSDEDSRYVANELLRATMLHAIHSKRQLYEVMVRFWTEHFSIYMHKNKTVTVLKVVDDRNVIRKHAMGSFLDLLKASANSPAMLHYLDNVINEKEAPNENYAREIMELHTLGVDGGYTEEDVKEVARCFTGWTVNDDGEFTFNGSQHDDQPEVVLGQTIYNPRDGKQEAEDVIELLANHPSTARFICTKLVRRFVADDPPEEIIETATNVWRASNGNMRRVIKSILMHPLFDLAPPKFKRPFEYVVSTLRALNADYRGEIDLVDRLSEMGMRPFEWVTPDGFPDVQEAWSNSILEYWNIGIDAARDNLADVDIDIWDIANHVDVEDSPNDMLKFFSRLLWKRDMNDMEAEELHRFLFGDKTRLNLENEDDRNRMQSTLGLMLSVPAFVMR